MAEHGSIHRGVSGLHFRSLLHGELEGEREEKKGPGRKGLERPQSAAVPRRPASPCVNRPLGLTRSIWEPTEVET